MKSLLHLVHVSKRFHNGEGCEVFPLRDVNLQMEHGERIILLGKSGSGKTTFLNLVGGMDSPTEGKIFFNGNEITGLSTVKLAEYRRKDVGFIFQSFNLFPTLTVGENLMLPLDLLGVSQESKGREMLSAVGLDGQWHKFPEQLSGGEQQRVAIARALIKEPRLILADEPTGNLDSETGDLILSLIYEICRDRQTTLIMVTHSSEALWMADRRFRLSRGRLLQEENASPKEPDRA